MRYYIGSRDSKLAVIQSNMVLDYLKSQDAPDVKLVTMKTTGDMILDKTLDKIGGKGLFVKELDRALVMGEVDLTVHSLKDMPMEISDEIPIIAFSKREDPRDCLILAEGLTKLDISRPIGCASKRRTVQLQKLYPEADIRPIRGNVQTRLRKLDSGEYGAIVLAVAGIKRLGLDERIHKIFSTEEVIPAAGQGILAVQGRKNRGYSYLDGFEDREGRIAALGERAFVRELDGGCSSPVCAYCTVKKEEVTIKGLYVDDSNNVYIDQVSGKAKDVEELGKSLARRLKEVGKR